MSDVIVAVSAEQLNELMEELAVLLRVPGHLPPTTGRTQVVGPPRRDCPTEPEDAP